MHDAALSRDLLLNELVKVLHQTFEAEAAIAFRMTEGRWDPMCFCGCNDDDAVRVAEIINDMNVGGDGTALRTSGRKQYLYRFRDDPEELSVWAVEGQSALDRAEFEFLCMGTELTLASGRRRRAGAASGCEKHDAVASAKDGIIYRSSVMRNVNDRIKMLRGSRATVLITGESGTGKELAARAIHRYSERADKTFIAYNASSIPREIAEAELFGYTKGTFTGAYQDSLGIIRSADGGTLFLDEIGDLPLEIQPKLLRFLENGEVYPLGKSKAIKTDIRVIAATNRDLSRMVAEGTFRADLWYRINGINIALPPLRDRPEDIPMLVHHLLEKFSKRENKKKIILAPGLLKELTLYTWPGNVRELANVIEQLVVFTPSGGVSGCSLLHSHVKAELSSSKLSTEVTAAYAPNGSDAMRELSRTRSSRELTLPEAVAELEQAMIESALSYHRNNISRAAATLGLSRFGLQRKLKRLSSCDCREAALASQVAQGVASATSVGSDGDGTVGP
jgi:transcriptional regulator with GAF, ATPase, and Fis domain